TGPGDGIAAAISTPAIDTSLTLSCGRLTSDTHNQASTARTAYDPSCQDTACRSITPTPPRKKRCSADDRLLNCARPVMMRTASPCQSYTNSIIYEPKFVKFVSLVWPGVKAWQVIYVGTRRILSGRS